MTILIAQLKFEEGLRLKRYKCTAGHWTIGCGHNLDAKPKFKNVLIPDVISKNFAEEILLDDVDETIDELWSALNWFPRLPLPQQDALVNMAFQMGTKGLMKFKKMLFYLERESWSAAASEALNSDWAKQTPNRARRVAKQIRTGICYVPGVPG